MMRRLLPLARGAAGRLRLNEAATLAVVSLVGLLGYGFVELAGEVRGGDTLALDRAILLALREPGRLADPLGPSWFEEAARDVTGLGGYAILTFMTLATVGYLAMTGRGHAAWLVIAAIGGGMLLSTLLKLGFARPRPDLVPHGTRIYTSSFPSGHAMLSAVTYLTLGALLARLHAEAAVKAFFLGLAVLLTVAVGASRVYLGVHWPSDVLAGWCVGAAWAGFCWWVALVLQRRGQVEPPAREAGPAPEAA